MTIKPYYQDNFATQYEGHVLDVLPQLPPESVHSVCTSPPYWGLRDYGLPPQIWDDPGGCEHEWGDEIIRTHEGGGNDGVPKEWQRPSREAHKGGSSGHFCQLCNAWRGSLGLEPTPELYIQHLVQIFREVRRVLRKDGTLWLNIGDSYASGKGLCFNPGGGANSLEGHAKLKEAKAYKLNRPNISDLKGMGLKPKDLCGIPWRVALALQADGWWLRSDIIWSKPNPMPESVTDRPTRAHEYVFLLTKSAKYFYDQDAVREEYQGLGKPRQFAKKGNQDRNDTGRLYEAENKGGRNLRSVWTIATQPYPKAHFAVFPEKLVEICILAATKEGDTVLDPFSGRGTVLTVAKRMFRQAIGIDLKAEYCEMSLSELKEEVFPFK